MYRLDIDTPITKSMIPLIKNAIVFFIIGGLSAIINITTFAALWEHEHLNYTAAVSFAYIISVIFHFIVNRRVTFKAHEQNIVHQLVRYSFMVVINYLFTLLIAQYTTEVLLLSPYIGVLAGIAATGMIGFFLAKFWVFKCVV